MKKIICLIIIIIILISVTIIKKENKEKLKENSEFRGIFISYIEISNYLQDKDEETSKNNINKMIKNIKEMNLNTIILQVRPSSDAIYNSKIFPVSKYLSSNNNYPYDVLEYFVKKSHENKLNIIAWVNPYRISTLSNIEEINKEHPAFKYIGTDTIYINNGIYYNPSKKEVNNLILDGIEEIIKYNIDGILFDDYFYPSDEIDLNDYENRINKELSLEEYHLEVVNTMIKKVHKKCKDNNILFGISPEGNIENNYHKNYADIYNWLSSDKYIDFIMPQIYYGFENTNKPFVETTNEWNKLIKNKDINLYIALAFYKVGQEDNYALNGKLEWINNSDIIMKEIIYSRNVDNYKGFSLYRYDNIFNKDLYQQNSEIEIKKLKSLLN